MTQRSLSERLDDHVERECCSPADWVNEVRALEEELALVRETLKVEIARRTESAQLDAMRLKLTEITTEAVAAKAAHADDLARIRRGTLQECLDLCVLFGIDSISEVMGAIRSRMKYEASL